MEVQSDAPDNPAMEERTSPPLHCSSLANFPSGRRSCVSVLREEAEADQSPDKARAKLCETHVVGIGKHVAIDVTQSRERGRVGWMSGVEEEREL